MTAVLELADGRLVAYDPATGDGVLLVRARPHRRRWEATVRADTDLLAERMWRPHLARFFDSQAARLGARIEASRRRNARIVGHDTRKAVDPAPMTEAERKLAAKRKRDEATRQAQQILDNAWDRQRFVADWVDTTTGLYDATVDTAASALRSQLGVSFDLGPSAETLAKVNGRANQLSGGIADTTYDRVKLALRDGILDGESIPDLANRVRAEFADMSQARATVIARTEVTAAYAGGTREYAEQLGPDVVGGMEWIATEDERTRPDHGTDGADGQIVPIDKPFIVGGIEMRYPGDPNAPVEQTANCRCAVAAVVPEDMPVMPGRSATVENVTAALLAVSLGRRHPVEAILALRDTPRREEI